MRDVDELVVTEVAAKWQSVALRLGVEGCLRSIILKNNPNDCVGVCHSMFNCWLRRDQNTGEGGRSSVVVHTPNSSGYNRLWGAGEETAETALSQV